MHGAAEQQRRVEPAAVLVVVGFRAALVMATVSGRALVREGRARVEPDFEDVAAHRVGHGVSDTENLLGRG